MMIQALAEHVFDYCITAIIVILGFSILYEYLKYSKTEEFQEYKLFNSEYGIYTNEKERLAKKSGKMHKKIVDLEIRLTYQLLNEELGKISINELDRAWKIGEKTISRLYTDGYRTLRDLDNFKFRRSSMPEYIGDFRYTSIKMWYEKEKERRRKRIINEIQKGSHSDTEIGRNIEITRKNLSICEEKLEKICRELDSFKGDFNRYREVSFYNYFLRRKIEVPYEKIVNLSLKEAECLLNRIIGSRSVDDLKNSKREELRDFYKEFLLLKEKQPYGYWGTAIEDQTYPYLHFFIIHKEGISFFQKGCFNIPFNEIKHCSKIGRKILLLLKDGTIKKISLKEPDTAYNYIKTLKDYQS